MVYGLHPRPIPMNLMSDEALSVPPYNTQQYSTINAMRAFEAAGEQIVRVSDSARGHVF